MPYKCCIFGCKTNYATAIPTNENPVHVLYSFPKDVEEQKMWMTVISIYYLQFISISISISIGCNINKWSSIYYLCGYVSFKMGCFHSETCHAGERESEFTSLVSRGKLKHPSEALYAFARCCYFIFKHIIVRHHDDNIKCANRMIRLFLCLSDVFPHDFGPRVKEVSTRLTNTFCKGFVSESLRMHAVVPCVPPRLENYASYSKL